MSLVKTPLRLIIAALLVAVSTQSSQANLVISFSAAGADTDVNISGSLDLTGWTTDSFGSSPGILLFSNGSSIRSNFVDYYERSDGTFTLFGTPPNDGYTSIPDPGFSVGYQNNISTDALYVPEGYVSGENININFTFSDVSFEGDLSLEVGDVWGVQFDVFDSMGVATGATQSVTFQGSAAVPEPTSFLMFGMTCTVLIRRRRSKN